MCPRCSPKKTEKKKKKKKKKEQTAFPDLASSSLSPPTPWALRCLCLFLGLQISDALSFLSWGAPWWLSGLRIQHCHCCGTGSIPGLGNLQIRGKKKKKAAPLIRFPSFLQGLLHFRCSFPLNAKCLSLVFSPDLLQGSAASSQSTTLHPSQLCPPLLFCFFFFLSFCLF